MCLPYDEHSFKSGTMGNSKAEKSNKSHDHIHHTFKALKNASVLNSPRRHLSDLLYVEHYENGGGYILHAYAHEIAHLSKEEVKLLANKFFRSLFTERQKKDIPIPFSYFCMGIVHGAAKHIPELVNYIANFHPNLIVSTSPLDAKNASYSITAKEFAENVFRTYCNGVYRYGPMHAISLVGVKGEERGKLFCDILAMIESDPFLGLVLPWGKLSSLSDTSPQESDDGPILWIRPGEQALPRHSTPKNRSKKAANFSLGTLSSSRLSNPRQILVQDRTPCHADHADDGLQRHTTAAIGLLKAIRPPFATVSSTKHMSDSLMGNSGNPYTLDSVSGRIIKDAVVFDPRHYWGLVERLGLDIMEPPAGQCGNFWADDGELNLLRTEGFRYARAPLRDNDIYFLPRGVVHQFKTVSAGTSIAWHTRLTNYYPLPTEPTAGGGGTSSSTNVTNEAVRRTLKVQASTRKRTASKTCDSQSPNKKAEKRSSVSRVEREKTEEVEVRSHDIY